MCWFRPLPRRAILPQLATAGPGEEKSRIPVSDVSMLRRVITRVTSMFGEVSRPEMLRRSGWGNLRSANLEPGGAAPGWDLPSRDYVISLVLMSEKTTISPEGSGLVKPLLNPRLCT